MIEHIPIHTINRGNMRSYRSIVFLVAALVAADTARAQRSTAPTVVPSAIAAAPSVKLALQQLERDNAWTLQQMVELCQVPAPPFKEAARAAVFRDKLVALGATNVRIDREGNVIGEVKGTASGPTVMISGHLDTVFPEGTDVTVKRDGTRLVGPGIGDDCRGLAVTLAVARQVITAKIPFAGRLLVVGTVGEEGAGNLRGVRALFTSALRDSVNYFLSVDGTGFGITNRGVGSNRYRVKYVGPGGHSYGAFGMPNPIHAMGRAIAKIADLQVPAQPVVTFNVGVVSGGTSVNSISATGVMEIDLRSESPSALAKVDAELQKALRDALDEERARWPRSKVALDMQIDTIGIRPAGGVPDTSVIVRAALDAGKTMNVYTPLVASSTDANFPMSLGIPAITIDGGGIGRSGHSLDESYDDRTDGYKGPQWVLLVVLGLTGIVTR
jgi:acetylornithine deacetylase/succinyl-diaminopimelate desuccinylase-like protein